ncbi:carbohydrate deacetylase [Paenibacillus terrigena]|uniref:carbohydrate deacetylase n=1 Tax=Paenibacillus terrigena TaxID=369333 RepID=UPI000372D995|nr:ChbG/HpnK family deacetylase [Paenibacillus terrigena]
MTKYVIINADDFGLSRGVNRGIIEAHQAGIVTSASLIVNKPGLKDAVAQAKRNPRLGVGLHFNLSDGKPITPPSLVPSLVNTHGSFHNQSHEWREEDVERELHAQWELMRRKGIYPTHIDSHMHIHLELLHVYHAVARLAFRELVPVRCDLSQDWVTPPVPVRTTDTLIRDKYNEPDSVVRLIRHIQWIQDGTTEIMCHPGYVDEELKRHSTMIGEREAELTHLTHREIGTVIRAYGLHLIHYGQLPDPPTFHMPPEPEPLPEQNSTLSNLLAQPKRRSSRPRSRLVRRKKQRVEARVKAKKWRTRGFY